MNISLSVYAFSLASFKKQLSHSILGRHRNSSTITDDDLTKMTA